jgi:hypothetical protein
VSIESMEDGSLSRAREALAARSQMGRWTHTFTRCPVSVAACSETKMSPNNTESRAWRLRFAVETRHNNKKGDLGYENNPTRRYLPRTQARSWSLLISGRDIAYRRDRTPLAYTRSEIVREAQARTAGTRSE